MGSVTHGESKKKKNGWDGRRKMVSAVAALMALLFLIPLVMEIFQYAGAVTLDEISSLNAQQEELEAKKSDLQSQLDDLKDQENSAVSRCNLLSKKINVLEDQIATTQSVVDEYADQIKENQKILKKRRITMTCSASGCGAWRKTGPRPIGRFSSAHRAFPISWTGFPSSAA